MSTEHALIVANGDCCSRQLQQRMHELQPANTFLLAVDGGLRHCINAGLAPNAFLGDADSTSPDALQWLAQRSVPELRFPSDKAASDLQLALEEASRRGIRQAWLYGVSGGRTDHMLFNWQLPLMQIWPFILHLHDVSVEATVVRAEHPATRQLSPGQTFSLLALSLCEGITIDGAVYPLDNASIAPGQTLGLSNVARDAQVSVSLRSGVAMLMINRENIE